MRAFLAIFAVVGLLSCTPEQRQGALGGAGKAAGAPAYPDGTFDRKWVPQVDAAGKPDPAGNPVLVEIPVFDGVPDYKPLEVAQKVATDTIQKAGSVPDLVYYLVSVVGGAIAGWAGAVTKESSKKKAKVT